MWCVLRSAASYIRQSDLGHRFASDQGCTSSRLHLPAVSRKGWKRFMVVSEKDSLTNNLFPVPFECLTMCLQKLMIKVFEPQGLCRGCFDPPGRHWREHLNSNSRLLFPLWRLYTCSSDDSLVGHIKKPTASNHSLRWKCMMVFVLKWTSQMED